MLDTLIQLAVVSYPLYQTANYVSQRVSDQNSDEKVKFNPKDVHFLATWWSAYGVLNLFEDMLSIDKIPLYGVAKTGVLISLMFKDYQNAILKKTADGASYVKTWIGETEMITNAKNKILTVIQDYQRNPLRNPQSSEESYQTSSSASSASSEDGYIDSLLKRIRG